MKIKMLEDAKGSECGKFVKEFKKDKIYPNVSEELAKVFIKNKLAISVADKKGMAKAKKAEEEAEAKAKAKAKAEAEEAAELAEFEKLEAEEAAKLETKVVNGNETEEKGDE